MPSRSKLESIAITEISKLLLARNLVLMTVLVLKPWPYHAGRRSVLILVYVALALHQPLDLRIAIQERTPLLWPTSSPTPDLQVLNLVNDTPLQPWDRPQAKGQILDLHHLEVPLLAV